MDVTWDDQEWGTPHWYFNLTTEAMNRSHTPEDGFASPDCISDAYSYGVVWGDQCINENELLAILPAAMKRLANGADV